MSESRGTVQVVDQVELSAGNVDGWLERWRTGYLPGAQQRGLTLVGSARRFTGHDSVAVTITWELPEPYAFYAMRAAAAADPSVAAFWAETDELAASRDRHVLRAGEVA